MTMVIMCYSANVPEKFIEDVPYQYDKWLFCEDVPYQCDNGYSANGYSAKMCPTSVTMVILSSMSVA